MQHAVVSRDNWLTARRDLLRAEKELTQLRDKVARERLALPWVRIDKEYVLTRRMVRVRSPISSTAARNFSCNISCSHRDGRKAARVARSWLITPTA